MSQLLLSRTLHRKLLADWFVCLAREAGFQFDQRSSSSESFTLGNQSASHVVAHFVNDPPYLNFISSDTAEQELVDELAQRAVDRVDSGDMGGTVWYTATLHEVPLALPSHSWQSDMLLRLGNQVRIEGWRRLGFRVLLEFQEEKPDDWETKLQIFAPKAIVKVHVPVEGPCAGDFSKSLATPQFEVVEAVCTFALGRPLDIPHEFFASNDADVPELESKRQDPGILNLARKGISLDVFDRLLSLGGRNSFIRVRASLLTFDAAVRQERDPVASVLYVVATEALAIPFAPWQTEKPTKRFIEFFNDLMPDDLDRIIAHGNFEEAFEIRRGTRTARALRRDLLDRIYMLRSILVHSGITPSYGGFSGRFLHDMIRRGLLSDFAEMAILRYLEAPRSSIIGHPAFNQNAGPSSRFACMRIFHACCHDIVAACSEIWRRRSR